MHMIADNIMRLLRVFGAKIQAHLGKLYVISSDNASYAEMCVTSFSPASQEDRAIALEPRLIDNLSEIQDEVLEKVIEETGANLISAVLDAEQGAPTFLMMRTPEEVLFDEADLFAFKVDKYNRDARSAMIRNMAVNDPTGFRSFMSTVKLEDPCLGITRSGRKTSAQKKKTWSGTWTTSWIT